MNREFANLRSSGSGFQKSGILIAKFQAPLDTGLDGGTVRKLTPKDFRLWSGS